MRRTLVLLALLASPVAAEPRFPAVLANHAILPADAIVPPPAGAPPGFALAGRWANPERRRADTVGAAPGLAGEGETARPTDLRLPLPGQPAGGLIGLAPTGDGGFWALGDAGYRSRGASPDVLLRLHRLRPDWSAGTVAIERTLFLADPARGVPFHIVTDPSPSRFLTGADFDPSGIVPNPAGGFWVAERGGPALLDFDAAGHLRDGFDARRGEAVLRAPDQPALAGPVPPGPARLLPGGGFAGLAAVPGGKMLWAMFGRPLRDLGAATGDEEEDDLVRLLEFDATRRDWTGREAAIDLSGPGLRAGGLVFLDERRALFIEYDTGEGDVGLACGRRRPPACFGAPARHKRLVLVDFGALDAEGAARRLGHVDLLDIADPEARARQHGDRGPAAPPSRFALPFASLGGLALVEGQVLLVNDNDPGRAAGRHLARADATEFVLLHVPELLATR